MNKSAQYNQQTKPKQGMSYFEEIYIYQNLESCWSQHLYLKMCSVWVPC